MSARTAWIVFGVATQILFAGLVVALIVFMQFTASASPAPDAVPLAARPGGAGWWLDALADLALVAVFAVPHSIALHPPVRRRLQRLIPPQLFGCCFCLLSCASLGSLMLLWRPLPGILWEADGVARWAVLATAGLAWLGLGHAMALGGFGWQTGLTSLRAYIRREPDPPRGLCRRGAYRSFRHPIYLAFLLVSWITPTMSTSHLLLSVGLTAYIAVGSWLKDRRLVRYLGDEYRDYMAEVPGYPGLRRGPLGVVRRRA